MSCQLTKIHECAQKNSWLNDLFQNRVRILRSLKRNAIYAKNRMFHLLSRNEKVATKISFETSEIVPGNLVRIRSRQEIRNMLDAKEKYKGCLFIDEMCDHCDKTYKVYKAIDHFFDEAKQKMCKCKDIFVLEDLLCSGRQRLYSVSCDRNCFFFWHKDWLEKVKPKG